MTPPARLLLAFYGDDFTGSTDAMEALALAGLRTVLFLAPPTPARLAERFADLRCLGVAGASRAMSPAEMDLELEPVLRELWSADAPLVHYKVCSTFDSSPTVGSIGHVIDMVRRRLTDGAPVSILAGAPPLRRYTVFGHHFAAAGDAVHRLDRHPTMSRHPITPMDESDLRVVLSRQSAATVALMSVEDLAGDPERVDARLAARLEDRPGGVLFDILDDTHLRAAGRLIQAQAQRAKHFVVGSSGVEYALVAHWRASGLVAPQRVAIAPASPVKQLLVVSGSASPVTARQIEWAGRNGFHCLRAPAAGLAHPGTADTARRECLDAALGSLAAGHSVLLYTAAGPDDPSIGETRERLGSGDGNAAKVLGAALGRIARELLARGGLRRVVIAGGDTSSYATRELGVYGLEMLAELTPGAPLCRGHADDARLDGLEIALKGGQMGGVDYFGKARSG